MLNSDVLYNITLFWETGCYMMRVHNVWWMIQINML